MVDFVESQQSRLCRFGSVHNGNKVDRISNKVNPIGNKVEHIGNKVDRNKMSNSRCCRFVAKTSNKVERIRQQSTLLPICCHFRQQSTFNIVDRVEFNFVASVDGALHLAESTMVHRPHPDNYQTINFDLQLHPTDLSRQADLPDKEISHSTSASAFFQKYRQIIIFIISGFGIYGAAVVPYSGVGNTWKHLSVTYVLPIFLSQYNNVIWYLRTK